jgi:hypothetical protein
LKDKSNPNKANIEIREYFYPSRKQATKAGILIENNDNDIVPSVKIIEMIQRKRFLTDLDVDPIPIDNDNCIIDFREKEKIDFKSSGKIIFIEIQKKNISFLLGKNRLLTALENISEHDYYQWDIVFEVFGKIRGNKFENGLFSLFIEANRRNGEVVLEVGDIVKK